MLPTFPSRYWYTIGLLRVFSLAGWSPRIQTGFHVSRPTQVALLNCTRYLYRTITVYGQTFQIVPIQNTVSFERSYYPMIAETNMVWALSLSIATTREIDLFFLFLRVLRCFSSPGWPHKKKWRTAFNRAGCPIRTSPDQNLFAVPRGFSQLTTSFVACRSLGILRSLL